jgi:uncharacterized protein (DUF2164 family)
MATDYYKAVQQRKANSQTDYYKRVQERKAGKSTANSEVMPAPVRKEPEQEPERMVTPSVTKQRSLTPEDTKKKFSLKELGRLWRDRNKDNVANAINTAAAINDVAGAKMRATVFGDTEDIVGGKKNATTGNKSLDDVAKAAGVVESFFIPAGEGGLFANATRKGAEGIVENIAAKTGSKILKNKLANRAAVGAVESVPYTAQQIGTQDMDTKEVLKTAALNTGLGVVAEPFLVGASALVKSIAKRMKAGKALTKTERAIVEKTPELKTYEQQLQDEITTPNPAQSEQIAEELRNAEPIKTVSQPERVIALKNLRMTMKEGTPEHAAISDAIDRLERETVASETPPVSAQPTVERVNIPPTVEKPPASAQSTSMLERTPVNVGDKKVKAYQFENPEVKPYYQDYAQYILDNEYVPNEQFYRTTDVMQKLKADTGLQPAQVKDALERLVADKGQENTAAAKRVEIAIDDMLTNGFTTSRGDKVPPIKDYIALKSKIEGADIAPRPEQTLDDMPVPESSYAKPANVAETVKPDEKIKDSDQIGIAGVNVREVKDQNGNINRMLSPYGQAWKNTDGTWGVQRTGETETIIANTENEARTAIDSGLDRTKAKPQESKEMPKQVSLDEMGKAPTNAGEQKFVDDYTKQYLPDDEEGLSKTIADLERQKAKLEEETKMVPVDLQFFAEKEQKLLRINLQLFAANEKLKAISKFKTNTLRKTPDLSDDEMQDLIDKLDMSYDVKTHKETIKKAKDMVDADMQGTIDRINEKGLESAEDTAAALLIERALKAEGKETGNFDKLKKWLKTVRKSGTSRGQTIEAFKIWQQEPDGMLKNATKTVEDAEDAVKKTNPEKIKQIDKETDRVVKAVDKVDSDTADLIQDEVNKKADEILKGKSGKKPAKPKEGDTGKTERKPSPEEEPTPEDALAKKIENYTKDPKTPEDDPIKDMVNELFRVAKESPIEKEKVKSRSAIEFVSEALRNRQQYVEVWRKAKEIVREKVKDNPEALAKLEAYFDKGIKPPFSSESFNKSIKEGMKALDQNLGKIVKDYYAQGSKSRQDLIKYLVEKSGLDGQDAEVLAKYVQNRMKELTKAKKEEILKGIFKNEKTAPAAKPGALKSVEELSNVGAFANDNYKDKVIEKLSSRLQRVINEKFKGTPAKASGATGISDRIDFGELVRKSVSEIDFTRTKFLKEISETIQVNDADARTILKAVEDRFNEIVDEKRASILGNMFKKREATIKKTGIQRVQEYINKQVELENLGAQEDAIRDFIKEKYGLPTLTNDDMAFITDHIDKLKTLEQGTRPYNETLWRIYNRIESKVPSNFIEKFRAWQRISMLPNIKTFLRNILGNVFMEKAENFNELTTEALVDWISSAFTGKREILGPTAAIQKSMAQTKGKVQGLSDVITDIKHGVNTYDVQGQYEINVSRNAFKNPVLDALEQFTNKTLQFGDRPFYEAAKARRLKELQLIKKTREITDDMEADAILYALDRTFQNDSKLAMGVQKMKKAIDHPVYEAIANIVVPFARTPANILDKISDYTPIGLIKAVGHLGKTVGKGTFNQLYFSQRLGRFLTGAGIITFGYILAKNGVITGKPEKTTTKKGSFDKETGKLGYALKTPDGYVSYDWAQPVGSLLALGADAYGQGMNKGDILKGLEGAGNTFLNMSMLQSLNSLMSYSNPMGGFISTMLGANQQFTPTILKQAARIADKFERDTTGESYWEETAKRFMSGIPGLRQTLPAKTDTFGKPIETQEGYGPLQKALNIAANPAIVTKNTMKDYEKEMDRLYNLDLGDMRKSDVLPSVLEKTITDGKGTEYTLTLEQYNRYKKLYGDIAVDGYRDDRGRLLRPGLEVVIRSAEYKKLSDKDKAKKISGILSKARDKATDKMLAELKTD